jgi:hypothetical protein
MATLASTPPSKSAAAAGNVVVQSPLGSAPHIATELPGPKAKALIERDEKYSSP